MPCTSRTNPPARPVGKFSCFSYECSSVYYANARHLNRENSPAWSISANRYRQICYPAFVPFNPRTPRQVAIRLIFAVVSARWRLLTQAQRDIWNAVGPTIKSRLRLRNGKLTGFHLFIKVNVARVHRGLPLAELPPADPRLPQLTGLAPFYTSWFDQLPVGPTLFLQANRLIDGRDGTLRKLAARVAPPA